MYNQEVKSWLKIIAMNQAATNPLMQTILRIPRTPRILRTHRRIPIQEVKTEQRTVEQETLRMHLLPTAKIHRTPTPTAKILLKTTHLLSTAIN